MSTAKATTRKRRAAQPELAKSGNLDLDLDLSSDIKGIMSALQQIREKAHKDGLKKNEETISSVAAEVRSVMDELKSKVEKDRQSFAKSLSKSSKEENYPYLEKASKRKAEYQMVLQENKKKKQGPVVPTSGASSSSDSLIAERSEPMPMVVNLSQSFAEGKLRKADELVKSTVGKMSENEPSPVPSLRLTGSLLPTMFVNLLVVLLLFSLPVGATEPVQSFASSCSVELEGFSPCYSYAFAAPKYHVDSPTLECCRAYTAAVDSGDDACFCILVRNPQALGISINKTRLLSLSSLCPTTIPSDLNSKCGDRVKDPPAFFIPETAALEQPSMARKGSFIPAFFVLLLIGLIRIILVLI